MITPLEDPFASNPYVAPEMMEHAEVDRPATALGPVWKWLVVALVIEAAMTVVMIIFHSSSPRVNGINIYAVANLVLSGVLAVTFAWLLARRSSGPRVILFAQLANLLIWLTLVTIIHFRFGIRVNSDGSLFLTSTVASATLTLVASLASSGTFRSRVIK